MLFTSIFLKKYIEKWLKFNLKKYLNINKNLE